MKHVKPSFGVPYPESRVEGTTLVRTCPACGVEFKERTDATGEMTTNHYAEHFTVEAEAGR